VHASGESTLTQIIERIIPCEEGLAAMLNYRVSHDEVYSLWNLWFSLKKTFSVVTIIRQKVCGMYTRSQFQLTLLKKLLRHSQSVKDSEALALHSRPIA